MDDFTQEAGSGFIYFMAIEDTARTSFACLDDRFTIRNIYPVVEKPMMVSLATVFFIVF